MNWQKRAEVKKVQITQKSIEDINKRQFIKKGILGLVVGICIAAFSKITRATQNVIWADGTKQSGAGISASDVTYENLNTNSDVGTGATQVAQGDHTHTPSEDGQQANGTNGTSVSAINHKIRDLEIPSTYSNALSLSRTPGDTSRAMVVSSSVVFGSDTAVTRTDFLEIRIDSVQKKEVSVVVSSGNGNRSQALQTTFVDIGNTAASHTYQQRTKASSGNGVDLTAQSLLVTEIATA